MKIDGAYSCTSGKTCGGSACEFEFEFVTINADLPHFEHRCVESLTGVPIPDKPVQTAQPPRDAGTYKTIFYGIWAAEREEGACSGNMAKTVLTCTNGE